jgi:hypothetical protein
MIAISPPQRTPVRLVGDQSTVLGAALDGYLQSVK